MESRQQIVMKTLITALIGVVLAGILIWYGGGLAFGYIERSIAERQEERQRLFDLQGPQEAYHQTLEDDVETIRELEERGLTDLFLNSDDVLSFVLNVEGLASRAGVNHAISDRGRVEARREQSRVSKESLEGLSPEERAAFEDLLERQEHQVPDIDALSSRRFVLETTGSFEATTQFVGLLEQSLPLVSVDSLTLQRRSVSELLREGGRGTPPRSLRGVGGSGLAAVMEVRVFLTE